MSTRSKVLVVDDKPAEIRDVLEQLSAHFEVVVAEDIGKARNEVASDFKAVLLDVRLDSDDQENREGLTFLAETRKAFPFLPVIMFSGFAGVSTAVEAMKAGAVDFLQKSEASPEQVVRLLRQAIKRANLERRVRQLEDELQQHESFEFIGEDPKLAEVRRQIELVAQDGTSSVLLRGETGTGKSLVARAIHRQGWRKEGPFVAVALVSLNASTLTSELFGHEKGAFTGADSRRIGFIEEANSGVLFLDEIGELPSDVQLMLLRFLDDHVIRRLGASREIQVDLQLVAATNAPLEKLVASRTLRSDLYYRLKAMTIELPPLRERRGDIGTLASLFLKRVAEAGRTTATAFSHEALALLEEHPWPGNVRELKYAVESAALHAKRENAQLLATRHLSPELREGKGRPPISAVKGSIDEALAIFELEQIAATLESCDKNGEEARRLLGYKHRSTMWRRVIAHMKRFPHLEAVFPQLSEGKR
jgi:DNA-binding NtrC family response regulator